MTEYECAYCDETTKACNPVITQWGSVLTKWGMADAYECTTHGVYYIMTDPMKVRGRHIVPDEVRHVEAKV